MSVKMKFGSKDIPFVYKGDKLVYPNPIKDGLLLWYDFKGMRNTDITKEVAKDLSGNGNDGTLTNFNFTEGSGYKDNTLVFDGVDDSLTIPELVLDETAMSVVHDGEIYAYEDDKVLTVSEDGEIVGGGKNLLIGSSNYNDWIIVNNALTPLGDSARHVKDNNIEFSSIRNGTSIMSHQTPVIYSEEYAVEADIELIEGSSNSFILGVAAYDKDGVLIEEEVLELLSSTGGAPNGSYISSYRGLLVYGSKVANNLWATFLVKDVRVAFVTVRAGIYSLAEANRVNVSNLQMLRGSNFREWLSAPEDYKTTSLSPTSITELQLYNKTLRKNELLHNAESKGLKKLKPGVVVQDGLVLHYDFSHESNNSEYKGKAFDYSGNGNHGALSNFNFTEESGYESKGMRFDGVDDFIDVDNDISLQITRNITLEALFYVNPLDVNIGSILVKGDNSGWAGNSYGIRQSTTNNANTIYKFFIYGEDVNNHKNRVDIAVSVGEIIHLSAQADFDKGEMSVYRNGQLIHTQKMIGIEAINTKGENLKVGKGYYDSFLNGDIYSTKVYNRALSPEEIQHNYQIEKEKFGIE